MTTAEAIALGEAVLAACAIVMLFLAVVMVIYIKTRGKQ